MTWFGSERHNDLRKDVRSARASYLVDGGAMDLVAYLRALEEYFEASEAWGPESVTQQPAVGDDDAEQVRDILVGMLAFDGSYGIHNYTRLGELRERAAKIIRHGEITAKQGEHYKPSQQPADPAPSPSMVGGAGIELHGWRPMSDLPSEAFFPVDVLCPSIKDPSRPVVVYVGRPGGISPSMFAWRPYIRNDDSVPPNWREIAEHFAAMEARGA